VKGRESLGWKELRKEEEVILKEQSEDRRKEER
jgi:hypothetical protein